MSIKVLNCLLDMCFLTSLERLETLDQLIKLLKLLITGPFLIIFLFFDQSQNAKRASSQKRHMVISIFLLCNSLILMSIGAGSIRAIKGGLGGVQQQKRQRTFCDFAGGMIFFVLFCSFIKDICSFIKDI